MTAVIEAQALTKKYRAGRGVEDLSLLVQRGEIFGYLGPNGAGKTTTIRLMLDFVRPTRGTIRIFGEDPKKGRHLRNRIGYLPGELGLHEDMTGLGLLNLYSALGGNHVPLRQWVCEALQLSDQDLKRPIRYYSKGMKQKLGVAQAIQHDPDLLILDEPTGGLDPVVQARFFEVLREFRRRGRTVFFSSHILSEVEQVCDRVAVLRDGRLVLDAKMSDLILQTDRLLYLKFTEEQLAAAAAASVVPSEPVAGEGGDSAAETSAAVSSTPAVAAAPIAPQIPHARYFKTDHEWTVYAVAPADVPDLLQYLAAFRPLDVRLESALEESFLQLYGVGGKN